MEAATDLIAFWTAFMAVATAASAFIAIPALVLSIINFVSAREPRVRWKMISDTPGEFNQSLRIVNSSRRWTAHVTSLEGFQGSAQFEATDEHGFYPSVVLPVDIEPGNWIHAQGMQFDGRERLMVKIEWRQRRFGKTRLRRRVLKSSLFM